MRSRFILIFSRANFGVLPHSSSKQVRVSSRQTSPPIGTKKSSLTRTLSTCTVKEELRRPLAMAGALIDAWPKGLLVLSWKLYLVSFFVHSYHSCMKDFVENDTESCFSSVTYSNRISKTSKSETCNSRDRDQILTAQKGCRYIRAPRYFLSTLLVLRVLSFTTPFFHCSIVTYFGFPCSFPFLVQILFDDSDPQQQGRFFR